jgi:hypothetical protein
MARKYVSVKTPKRPVGKRCMHCNRPAKVVGVDATDDRFRHRVFYCLEHAQQFGAVRE